MGVWGVPAPRCEPDVQKSESKLSTGLDQKSAWPPSRKLNPRSPLTAAFSTLSFVAFFLGPVVGKRRSLGLQGAEFWCASGVAEEHNSVENCADSCAAS